MKRAFKGIFIVTLLALYAVSVGLVNADGQTTLPTQAPASEAKVDTGPVWWVLPLLIIIPLLGIFMYYIAFIRVK